MEARRRARFIFVASSAPPISHFPTPPQADLQALITKSFKPVVETVDEAEKNDDGYTIPVTTCPIYLRIQPCLAPLPYAVPSSSGDEPSTPVPHGLFFLLLLRDPTNKLVHSSLSQSIPSEWLDIPFEENEWVEDVMVDVIARSVQVIGKDYIHARMTAQTVAINKAVSFRPLRFPDETDAPFFLSLFSSATQQRLPLDQPPKSYSRYRLPSCRRRRRGPQPRPPPTPESFDPLHPARSLLVNPFPHLYNRVPFPPPPPFF